MRWSIKVRLNNYEGFTLLEMLVSLVIFGVVLGGVIPAFLNQVHADNDSEQKIGAAQAAQHALDVIRKGSIASLPSTGTSPPTVYTSSGRSYVVLVDYCVNPSYCSASSRHLRVRVKRNGKQLYALETVYMDFE